MDAALSWRVHRRFDADAGVVRRVRPAFVMAGGLGLGRSASDAHPGRRGLRPRGRSSSGPSVLSLGVAPVFTLAPTSSSGAPRPSGPGRRRGSRRPAPSSAGLWVSRSSAASAPPSTAARWPIPFPADVSPEAAEAARDTLGGAVAAADSSPDRVGAELLEAAREAFTQGLQLTAIMSAAIVLGMAILAAVVLRHVRPGS